MLREGILMAIHCGVCHEELKEEDLVTLDFIYTLRHYTCLGADILTDIDTYKNIIEKYPYLFRHFPQ